MAWSQLKTRIGKAERRERGEGFWRVSFHFEEPPTLWLLIRLGKITIFQGGIMLPDLKAYLLLLLQVQVARMRICALFHYQFNYHQVYKHWKRPILHNYENILCSVDSIADPTTTGTITPQNNSTSTQLHKTLEVAGDGPILSMFIYRALQNSQLASN